MLYRVYFNSSEYRSGSSYPRTINPMYPYRKTDEEYKTILDIFALGVKKEDVVVELKDSYTDQAVLSIKGSTDNERLGVELPVDLEFDVYKSRIEKIDWQTEDGILTVEIFWKKPEKSNIKINSK